MGKYDEAISWCKKAIELGNGQERNFANELLESMAGEVKVENYEIPEMNSHGKEHSDVKISDFSVNITITKMRGNTYD